jgi:hypothetical protein
MAGTPIKKLEFSSIIEISETMVLQQQRHIKFTLSLATPFSSVLPFFAPLFCALANEMGHIRQYHTPVRKYFAIKSIQQSFIAVNGVRFSVCLGVYKRCACIFFRDVCIQC